MAGYTLNYSHPSKNLQLSMHHMHKRQLCTEPANLIIINLMEDRSPLLPIDNLTFHCLKRNRMVVTRYLRLGI